MPARSGVGSLAALVAVALSLACQSPPPAASDPDDPFDALRALARTIVESAEIARADEAASVPNGRGEGALHVLRLLRRAVDEVARLRAAAEARCRDDDELEREYKALQAKHRELLGNV